MEMICHPVLDIPDDYWDLITVTTATTQPKCKICNGDGEIPDKDGMRTCPHCWGNGYEPIIYSGDNTWIPTTP